MAYIEVSAFKKLRAFFWALQKISFNLNKLPFKDDAGTEVDKPYCLNLLRTFPDFQGEDFKDDNFLVNHLAKSGNIKQILDQFTQEQQTELTKIFEEKPIEGTAVSEQPAGAGQAEPLPAGEPSATMAGQGIPNLPSGPSVSSAPRRIIHNIPQDKPPIGGREGGTGAGTAATNKAASLADKGVPSAFQKAFEKTGKGLASDAGIGIKKGLAKAGSGLSAMAGGVGRGLGDFLSGAGGGGARFLGRTFLRGGYALSDIGTQMTRSRGIGIPKKVWLFLGGFIMFTFLTGFTGAPGSGGPGSSPQPVTSPSPRSPVPIAATSCPIPDGRISCGSFENQVRPCHCTDDYPPRKAGTLCNPLEKNGILTRTAKSIDVMPKGRDGQPGDKVYLPSIPGQTTGKWRYIKTDTDQQGFGHLRLFQSEPTAQGTWSMYMIHVDHDNPSLTPGTLYDPGQEVAWIGPRQDHVHINIGLNISNFGGADYFDPGWKFPDTQMGMCTGVTPPVPIPGGKTIVLNPGHMTAAVVHGTFRGAPGEPEKNVDLAKKIEGKLKAKGFNVFLTHDENSTFDKGNRYNDYQQRIDFTNDYNNKNPNGGKADLFVEIHFNSDASGPQSFYADRFHYITYSNPDDDCRGTQVTINTPKVVPGDPAVTAWINNSQKIGKLITKHVAQKLNQKYHTTYPEEDSRSDVGYGGACGGHLFTLGPQGTNSSPHNDKSKIERENEVVSAYIETVGMSNPAASDLDLFADGYVDGIVEYFQPR